MTELFSTYTCIVLSKQVTHQHLRLFTYTVCRRLLMTKPVEVVLQLIGFFFFICLIPSFGMQSLEQVSG